MSLAGVPRTIREVFVDLNLSLPREFPNFSVGDDNDGIVRIRFPRQLSDDESKVFHAAYARQGLPQPSVVEVVADLDPTNFSFRHASGRGDIDLVPSRRLKPDIPRSIRLAVEDDEDFWAARRDGVLATTTETEPQRLLPDGYLGGGLSCLVNASVFPRENIRNYLCLYDTVHLVAPLGDNGSAALSALGITPVELVELVRMRRVRLVLPQSIDRYDPNLIGRVAEAAPEGLLLSRRLAAATIVDTRKRWPVFYPPCDTSDRRKLLEALTALIGRAPSRDLQPWLTVLRDTLIETWTTAELAIHSRGAMGTMTNGVPALAARLFQTVRGKDLSLEIWTAGSSVEWASALGANLFPFSSDGYSEESAAELVASMYAGLSNDRPPTVGPGVHAVLDGILSLDNDIPVIPFAKDFGSGDINRLRALVSQMATWNVDADTLKDAIEKFNDNVRQVERRPDRLRTMNIVSFVAAVIAASIPSGDAHTDQLRRYLPVGATLMNMLLLSAGEELVSKRPALGAVFDFINGGLAGQRPGAVLVARAKKHLKILKG